MEKFSYELFTFSKPYSILIIIPIILIILFEKTLILKNTLIIAIASYCTFHLSKSLVFIDIWIILSISIILLIYSILTKQSYHLQGNFLIGDMEKFIYEKDFRNVLTELEFNFLFSSAKPNRLRENNSNIICEQNKQFEKVYYFAMIPLSSPIDIKKNDILISYLKESSWIGIIELTNELQNQMHPNNKKYGNKLSIEFDENLEEFLIQKQNWLISLSVKNKNCDIIYYEWDKDIFLNLFKYSTDYSFVNKIMFIWLKYLSFVKIKLDDHYSKIKLALENNDLSDYDKIDPLSRYEKTIENKLNKGKIDYLNEYNDLREPFVEN